MEKLNEKHQKDIGNCEEVSRHKKKSKKKGLARSKHKHRNIMVCLEIYDKNKIVKYGDSDIRREGGQVDCLAEVCEICGRVKNIYYPHYTKSVVHILDCVYFHKDKIPEGMTYGEYLKTLPVWESKDEKIAHRKTEGEE